MPLDQASAGTLVNLAQSFLKFLGEEAQEGHHPPNPQQHQQTLGGGGTDINQPATYPNKEAGGMLLLAPDGRALFVRRAQNARDHAGAWSIPGGMTEGDEMPWETALRETKEEVGDVGFTGNPQLLDHNIMDNVGFTTFGGKVNNNFTPRLNKEHDAFQWARPDAAPQPLHPGLQSTLKFAQDPLTEKGSKIMSSMKQQYGPEKGERVFYASKNKGTISGVDDSYRTTGRQDTQIPRPVPVNTKISTPFNANVDRGADSWASPSQVTDPNSGMPPIAARRDTQDAWRSPRQDAVTTPHKALKPAALKPVAATAGSHALAGRRKSGDQGGATQHPFSGGKITGSVGDLSRFVLRDTATDTEYALDKPLSADFTPIADWASPSQDEVTEDAGGGAGGWGHGGLAPPTQQGAQAGVDAPWAGGSSDPTAPAGTPTMAPPALPSGGRGGGMRGGTSQGMPGSGMAMNGPKLTHSYKAQYPDGSVDERKITRPGGPSMGQSPADAGGAPWSSPPQAASMTPPPQQGPQSWGSPPQDGGWPNSATLGPSPKGGRAGSRGGGIAGRV